MALQRGVALALALALVLVAPVSAASPAPAVKITKLVIEPSGPDFNITVSYSTSFLTKVFSLLFGSRIIEPAITDQLSGFDNLALVSVDPSGQTAKLVAKDQAQLSNGWYVYGGGAKFPARIDQVEVRGKAMDKPLVITGCSELPTFFYRP